MPRIAFDLDGVLIDVIPCVQKHLFDMYGEDGELADNKKFRLETIGGHTQNQIWKAINLMYCDIDCIEPGIGAAAVVNYVYLKCKRRERVTVVTARPERCRLETWAILDRLFPGIEFNLVMDAGNGHKVRHLDGIDYFVEDRRKNAIVIAGAVDQVFLLDRPYNQFDCTPQGCIVRIKDLYELFKFPKVFD